MSRQVGGVNFSTLVVEFTPKVEEKKVTPLENPVKEETKEVSEVKPQAKAKSKSSKTKK